MMLQTIREFGIERLRELGELERARSQHMELFAGWVVIPELDALDGYLGAHSPGLQGEEDNVREAIAYALQCGESKSAQTLASGLGQYWWEQGLYEEALSTWDSILNQTSQDGPQTRAIMMGWTAEWAWLCSLFTRTWELAQSALVICRDINYRDGLAANLYRMARVATNSDPIRAIEFLNEALIIFQEEDDPRSAAWTLIGLGYALASVGKMDDAAVNFQRASARVQGIEGQQRGGLAISCLQGEAWHAIQIGDLGKAENLAQTSLAEAISANNPFGQGVALRLLGRIAYSRHDLDRSREYYVDALRLAQRLSALRAACYCLSGLAAVSVERGNSERAALLLGAQSAILEPLGPALAIDEQLIREKLTELVRTVIGQAGFEALLEQGMTDSWELVSEVISERAHTPRANKGLTMLTRRERDVLELLVPGHTNREIAARLFVSQRTVDTHVASIMTKLDVHGRRYVVLRARELGLIAP